MHVEKGIAFKVTLVGCGLVLLAFGIVFTIIWPSIYDDIISKFMQLTPQSYSYQAWKQPPIHLSLDIYMFNWTNHEDFKNHSVKPHFEQLGPFRFTEIADKVNIKFNPQNSTVTYRRLSTFHFDKAGSKGNLDDIITSVNVVSLLAGEKARFADGIKASGISICLSLYRQEIHVTKTVGELLFEGYEDHMVSLAKQLTFLTDIEVPFDHVGWLYQRNNSADATGWFNAHTGVDDIRQLGVLKTWKFKNTNGAFEGDCGLIHGSAGEFFAPKQSRHSTISIFTPDICRSIPLDYERDVNVHGLLAYKFIGGRKAFDNGSMYPENLCFAPGKGSCSGVLNISSCRFGLPVFISYPQFFEADPYYIQQIEGMDPDEQKHQFYMSLEPSTGIALDVAARLQINVLIDPNPNVGIYSGVPKHYMPILWFEQRVTISPEMAVKIAILTSIPWIGQVCSVIVFLIGLPMVLCLPIRYFLNKGSTVQNGETTDAHNELEEQKELEDSPLLMGKQLVHKAEFVNLSKSDI